MKKSTVIIIAIVIAVIAFLAGTFYGKSSAAITNQTAFGGNGGTFVRDGGRFGGGAGGANIVAGQIISENGQSFTVQLPNGNSQVVYYSPATQITVTKTASGTASDLAVGTDIIVTSSTSQSGVVTANAIQVRQGGGVFFRANGG